MQTEAKSTRIKDIASLSGARNNQLFGYGLVIGLVGTGDGTNTKFTIQSLVSMLKNMGSTVPPETLNQLKPDNVASVMVTANVPPFARAGQQIDCIVSSIGDCKSLQGGQLLMTPLRDSNGNIYAVAQGAVSIGGFNLRGGGGAQVRRNHENVGRIPNGAIMELDIPTTLVNEGKMRLLLNNSDYTTATRVKMIIDELFGIPNLAETVDAATIDINSDLLLGKGYQSPVEIMAMIEDIEIPIDAPARVVVNERTGTVVAGENVRVSTIAIAHGNLNLNIGANTQQTQAVPFSPGSRPGGSAGLSGIMDKLGPVSLIPEGATIGELVQALNAIGVTSRDIIAILQAAKEAGALKAELVIM